MSDDLTPSEAAKVVYRECYMEENPDIDKIRRCLGIQGNKAPPYRDEDDKTAVYYAACRGHVEILSLLLTHSNYKEIFDLPDTYEYTPIIIAAWNGRLECVKVLYHHGADLTHRDEDGNTALDAACQNTRPMPFAFLEHPPDLQVCLPSSCVLLVARVAMQSHCAILCPL